MPGCNSLYVATAAGTRVYIDNATNAADAQYRYDNEIVLIPAYKFVGTRADFLAWYKETHEFALAAAAPIQEDEENICVVCHERPTRRYSTICDYCEDIASNDA